MNGTTDAPIAPSPDATARASLWRARALNSGFDAVGFCSAQHLTPAKDRLNQWLAQGFHGDMGWMAETAERRADPQTMWPEAKSAILVGVNYRPGEDPLEALTRTGRAAISVYAQGQDYHDVIKRRLKALASDFARAENVPVKIFVDTAPVMEKPLAAQAGLGWQGKHTNMVSRQFGSWLFLGVILTSADLAPDSPHEDHCGSCSACLDICPTKAFTGPYQLDARRCISYLTIEHKGTIPSTLRPAMGNRIYGCDDCLAVCPWNKFAVKPGDSAFLPRAELTAPRLADLAALDDAGFRQVFAGSPIKRIGRDRFVRNVLIALGNSGEAVLLPAVLARLSDESPLVRAMAVWALKRLAGPKGFAGFRARAGAQESDPDVRAEWDATS